MYDFIRIFFFSRVFHCIGDAVRSKTSEKFTKGHAKDHSEKIKGRRRRQPKQKKKKQNVYIERLGLKVKHE